MEQMACCCGVSYWTERQQGGVCEIQSQSAVYLRCVINCYLRPTAQRVEHVEEHEAREGHRRVTTTDLAISQLKYTHAPGSLGVKVKVVRGSRSLGVKVMSRRLILLSASCNIYTLTEVIGSRSSEVNVLGVKFISVSRSCRGS